MFAFLFQSLLHDPNPNSPANNEAAQLYRENRREYEKKVAAIVQESWNDDGDEDGDDEAQHLLIPRQTLTFYGVYVFQGFERSGQIHDTQAAE